MASPVSKSTLAPIDAEARPIYTLTELMALEDVADRWIIPGVLQAATRAILYGHGSVGKSLVAFDLAVSVAAGTPFLGSVEPIRTGPVLVLSTEGDIYHNRDRLAWICRAHDVGSDIPVHFCQDAYILDLPEEQAAFRKAIEDIKPLVVILDPLDSFFWGEENSATATKPIRHFLNGLIRDFRMCIFVLHHASGKPVEAGALRRPRGTTAWHGWADTIIRARHDMRTRGVSTLVLDAEKQRNWKIGEVARVTPKVDATRGLITFTGDDGINYGAHATRVVELLQVNGPMTTTALRKAIGCRSATVRQVADALAAQGVVREVVVSGPNGAPGRKNYGYELLMPTGNTPPVAPQQPTQPLPPTKPKSKRIFFADPSAAKEA